jgi:hypothetical protein
MNTRVIDTRNLEFEDIMETTHVQVRSTTCICWQWEPSSLKERMERASKPAAAANAYAQSRRHWTAAADFEAAGVRTCTVCRTCSCTQRTPPTQKLQTVYTITRKKQRVDCKSVKCRHFLNYSVNGCAFYQTAKFRRNYSQEVWTYLPRWKSRHTSCLRLMELRVQTELSTIQEPIP